MHFSCSIATCAWCNLDSIGDSVSVSGSKFVVYLSSQWACSSKMNSFFIPLNCQEDPLETYYPSHLSIFCRRSCSSCSSAKMLLRFNLHNLGHFNLFSWPLWAGGRTTSMYNWILYYLRENSPSNLNKIQIGLYFSSYCEILSS